MLKSTQNVQNASHHLKFAFEKSETINGNGQVPVFGQDFQ